MPGVESWIRFEPVVSPFPLSKKSSRHPETLVTASHIHEVVPGNRGHGNHV